MTLTTNQPELSGGSLVKVTARISADMPQVKLINTTTCHNAETREALVRDEVSKNTFHHRVRALCLSVCLLIVRVRACACILMFIILTSPFTS
jgi:hypothetical protein